MLLIHATTYLIDKIEEHLAYRLKCDKSVVDQKLAEKLKLQFDTKSSHVPSHLLHLQQYPNNANSSFSSVPQVNPEPVNQNAVLSLVESEARESMPSSPSSSSSLSSELKIDEAALALPKSTENLDFSLFGPNEQTTPMQLRLVGGSGARTWTQFMRSSYDELSHHLRNELKREDYTYLKMIILARFKEHLSLLSQFAQQKLEAREKAVQQIPDLCFDDSVDQWLVNMLQKSLTEARELINLSKADAVREISIPYMPVFSAKPNAGKTEVILAACHFALVNFLDFCIQADANRRKAKSEYGSMRDVYLGAMKQRRSLTTVNQNIAIYVIENLYEVGEYKGYVDNNLGLPLNYYLYDPDVANEKRRVILENIRLFDEKSAEESSNPDAFWEHMLLVPHRLVEAAKPVTSHYTLFQQTYNTMCQNIHTGLSLEAQSYAPRVAGKHTLCTL